jgi:hypothetical protein
MTTLQRVALVFGIGFLAAAIAGFLASGSSMDADPTTAPRALGLFPVNLLHNLVHLLFGVWGLLASRSWSGSKLFAQVGGVAYILLVVLAFVDPTTFGFIPIGGNDIWLHAVLGIPLAFFGFTAREREIPVRRAA